MTKAEYQAYEQEVAGFFEREGINCLTTIFVEDEGPPEPYFSWRPCECCGSSLGGSREDCQGYNPSTKEIQGPYSICSDCVYYVEYGRLDDTTMLDIEE